MKRIFVILGLTACLAWIRAEDLRVVSYNVENLFHPKHDTVCIDSTTFIEKDDYEWTADGERRWSYTRYYRKVENIARVLTNIGEWDGVDIVGLQEVENALCVKRLCYTLRPGEYDFVHYESPDPRGIDVALIYKKSRVDTLNSKPLPVEVLRTATGSPIEQSSSPAISSMSVRKSIKKTLCICSFAICRANEAERQRASGRERR